MMMMMMMLFPSHGKFHCCEDLHRMGAGGSVEPGDCAAVGKTGSKLSQLRLHETSFICWCWVDWGQGADFEVIKWILESTPQNTYLTLLFISKFTNRKWEAWSYISFGWETFQDREMDNFAPLIIPTAHFQETKTCFYTQNTKVMVQGLLLHQYPTWILLLPSRRLGFGCLAWTWKLMALEQENHSTKIHFPILFEFHRGLTRILSKKTGIFPIYVFFLEKQPPK